jgi:probable HAF family extracellular repeat protein
MGPIPGRRLILTTVSALALSILPRSAMATSFTVTTLPNYPGALETDVVAINDVGQFAGFFFDSTGGKHGFVNTGGVFGAPISYPGGTNTSVEGLNNVGQLVGSFSTAAVAANGFLDTGGTFMTIDWPGAFATRLSDINNKVSPTLVGGFNPAGVLGQGRPNPGDEGFSYSSGSFMAIIDPAGVGTQAFGVNDSGQVVGAYSDGTAPHGFLDNGGVFTAINAPGALGTIVGGINDSGQMDGAYVDATMTVHAFFYDGSTFSDIPLPGAFSTLGGINDAGQVVGTYKDTSGVLHGFLATPSAVAPVPEPATLTLLGTGVLAALRRRLRARRS